MLPSVRPGIDVEITREPVGVVGLITPWNFPIAIPAWKIAPALAYGNTRGVQARRPRAGLAPGRSSRSSAAPACPTGVFNLVMGRGSVVGAGAASSRPDVNAHELHRLGRAPARSVAAARRSTHMRKVQLEMGGKNPLIVLDDADLDERRSSCAVNSAYFSTGQRCTASSPPDRHRGHPRQVRRGAGEAHEGRSRSTTRSKHGHRHRPGRRPDASSTRTSDYIADRPRRKARELAFGGERLEPRDRRASTWRRRCSPSTTPQMRINKEEMFGPVASVISVKDYDEALAVANDTAVRPLGRHLTTTSLEARARTSSATPRPAW